MAWFVRHGGRHRQRVGVGGFPHPAGVALAELYETDTDVGRTINLSTRGLVRAGDGILIGGVVVRGPGPKRLLVRAIGPTLGGFGVPIITVDGGRPVFGPVVVPAPSGDDALALWHLTLAFSTVPGLYELKTPKTADDLRSIGRQFEPYLSAREWPTIQTPAP